MNARATRAEPTTLTSSTHVHSSSVKLLDRAEQLHADVGHDQIGADRSARRPRRRRPRRSAAIGDVDTRAHGLDAVRLRDQAAASAAGPFAVEVEQHDVHPVVGAPVGRAPSPKPDAPPVTTATLGHQLSSGVGEVHVQAGELRRRDAPLAVDLLVGLVVVAEAVRAACRSARCSMSCSAHIPRAVVGRRDARSRACGPWCTVIDVAERLARGTP